MVMAVMILQLCTNHVKNMALVLVLLEILIYPLDDEQNNTSRVKQEFGSFVNQSTLSDRVKNQMLALLDSSNWQKLNS
jgi:hypothetical protein